MRNDFNVSQRIIDKVGRKEQLSRVEYAELTDIVKTLGEQYRTGDATDILVPQFTLGIEFDGFSIAILNKLNRNEKLKNFHIEEAYAALPENLQGQDKSTSVDKKRVVVEKFVKRLTAESPATLTQAATRKNASKAEADRYNNRMESLERDVQRRALAIALIATLGS